MALICSAALATGVAAHAQAYLATDEVRNVQQVNATRASKGMKPLVTHTGLQAMARAQAVRMMQRGSIYHNPNLSRDITALGVNWKMVGENVGMGPDEDAIEGALLKSPHHYENIIRSNYNDIGVGIVKGTDGNVYLVQVFAEIVPAAPKVAAKPAPRVAPRSAAVRHVAHPAVAPKHAATAPKTAPVIRRADPNALVGGHVVTADLQNRARHRGSHSLGGFGKLMYALSLWS